MIRILALILLFMSPAASIGQTSLSEPQDRPASGYLQGSGTGDIDRPAGAERPVAPEETDGVAEEPVVEGGVTRGPVEYASLNQPGRISTETATIQQAWDSAPDGAGVAEYRDCGACVYRVRTRELMVTTIILPNDRKISQVDAGDPVGFEIQSRAGNMIVVRPRTIGIDTNMNVYTDKGVMSFYLRAEGFDSGHIPDLVVRIESPAPLSGPPAERATSNASITPGGNSKAFEGLDPAKVKKLKGLGAGSQEFDPAKLRGWGQYTLKGAKALRPETVFRDDHFTYVHFGDRWRDIELPVAFVVIDGIDETVNTRVQGQMLIVESTAVMISLKSGEQYLCIEYQGGEA